MPRPSQNEYPDYFSRYVDLVSGEEIQDILLRQQTKTEDLLSGISEEKAGFRYAPGKWSIREVAGHIIDTERIFSYRALRFARSDSTDLSPFDENAYVEAADFDTRTLPDIIREYQTVREATRALFRSFNNAVLLRQGSSNGRMFSVRAIGWIIAGHEWHHYQAIRKMYLTT